MSLQTMIFFSQLAQHKSVSELKAVDVTVTFGH